MSWKLMLLLLKIYWGILCLIYNLASTNLKAQVAAAFKCTLF